MSDTTLRDQLADLIAPHLDSYYGIYDGCDAAIAAGWRPPARRIETAEDLAALPVGTVVVTSTGKPWERITETRWEQGRYGLADSHALIAHHPVMTVLWEPEQEGRRD